MAAAAGVLIRIRRRCVEETRCRARVVACWSDVDCADGIVGVSRGPVQAQAQAQAMQRAQQQQEALRRVNSAASVSPSPSFEGPYPGPLRRRQTVGSSEPSSTTSSVSIGFKEVGGGLKP